MVDPKFLKFDTMALHGGQRPDPTTGAIMQPIYATSTYLQESPGIHKGFEYSRTQNPTRMAYERCVADLESRDHQPGNLSARQGSGDYLFVARLGAATWSVSVRVADRRQTTSGYGK